MKILRYEDKIHRDMKPQLDLVLKKRDQIFEELAEYLQLKNVVEMVQQQKLKKFESMVDVGCNIFVETEVHKLDKIMVCLNSQKDFFVELSLPEALQYIESREKYLNKKVENLTKKACEVRAHIVFVQETIRELLNIGEDKVKPERQMM